MKKLLPLVLLIASTIWFAACGSSNSVNGLPPVNGGGNNGYSAASLSGTWVFTIRGSDYTGDVFSAIGVFTADGSGHITGGIQDFSDLASGFSPQVPFTGGYVVNSDGRGQAQFNYSGNNGNTQFRFVFTSSGAARIIEISNSEDSTGQMLKQDSSAASGLGASTFVLRLDGYAPNGRIADVGRLTANNGIFAYTYDENYNANVTTGAQLTGAYTLGSNGRGTATLGSRNFVFYIVSANHLEFMESTNASTGAGAAELQSTGFSTAGLTGNYVFGVSGVAGGASGYVPVNEAGRATLDGAGNITSGARDFVENAGLTSSTPVGNYTVDANTGHFTLVLTNGSGGTYDSFSGYLINNGWGSMLTNAGSAITSGSIRQQAANPSNATLNGNYGLQFSGVNWNTGYNLEWISSVKFDGAGNFSGTADYATGGSLAANTSVSGTYNFDANGRATATLNGIPFVFYDVDGTQAYILSLDSSRQYQGNLVEQAGQ